MIIWTIGGLKLNKILLVGHGPVRGKSILSGLIRYLDKLENIVVVSHPGFDVPTTKVNPNDFLSYAFEAFRCDGNGFIKPVFGTEARDELKAAIKKAVEAGESFHYAVDICKDLAPEPKKVKFHNNLRSKLNNKGIKWLK